MTTPPPLLSPTFFNHLITFSPTALSLFGSQLRRIHHSRRATECAQTRSGCYHISAAVAKAYASKNKSSGVIHPKNLAWPAKFGPNLYLDPS